MTPAAGDESRAGDFLERMARSSRRRVEAARGREPQEALARRASAAPPPPPLELGDFGIIAEIKLRSPAAGTLIEEAFDRDAQVSAYASSGASAVSVLTEPDEFHGSLQDLGAAAASLLDNRIPAMRKDFLTDPYQVLEARAVGAGGVLVIVTMLNDAEVTALLESAAKHGMFVLLEGFDQRDLERISALDVGARSSAPVLCGVNCRDLKSLEVDFSRFAELAPFLPPGLPAVAESGIAGPGDVAAVAKLGYRAALVGSALMRSSDAAGELAALKQAGAEALREAACS